MDVFFLFYGIVYDPSLGVSLFVSIFSKVYDSKCVSRAFANETFVLEKKHMTTSRI